MTIQGGRNSWTTCSVSCKSGVSSVTVYVVAEPSADGGHALLVRNIPKICVLFVSNLLPISVPVNSDVQYDLFIWIQQQ
jgi:hypothetical protein